jgi:hypothetical protein
MPRRSGRPLCLPASERQTRQAEAPAATGNARGAYARPSFLISSGGGPSKVASGTLPM